MKKKSTSQSAFFNLRVLVGLFIALAGLSLALLATANPPGRSARAKRVVAPSPGKYKVTTQSSTDPLVPAMFDCSKIHQLGIDRQENFRAGAIMMFCGQFKGVKSSSHGNAFSKLVQNLTAPLVFGATDVDLITGDKSFPNVTQSETFTTANPDDPSQVFVAYNDSRGRNFNPINISGGSFSSDGGTTFTRLTKANGQSPFDNTFGDPVILFHEPSGTWVTVWLDGACGGQGLGGYSSTTPGDPDSWTHFCAFNEGSADRESGWADNNPSSPFFGRLYISWNDFNIGQGALMSIHSTDGGVTWSSPATVINGGTFIRDVQITGDLAGSGTVYIAGMDEGGGGFPHNDTNLIFKSTDGGTTWTNTFTGTPFPGPGVTAVGYFACMFNDFGGYWRHEGWGEPAAVNNFVHLVYSQQGAPGDPGDVYYIRSTDGGVTFAAPFKLNTDSTLRPQWQANISVSPTGTLLATWYDARESTNCVAGDPNTPCYRMFSRKSNDNGASWLPDDMLSDVVTPLPGQPDTGIQPTYAGDYDYGSAIASKHMTSWTDGRNAISGQSQQDAFTDRDLVGFSVTTADPACGSLVIGTAPTAFTVDLSDPADPATVEASDFTVNGTPADSFTLSNGNATIEFDFNTSPVTPGENTMHIDAGAIHQASNNDPILEFNCTFRFTQEQLAVTDTDPPVGGTFTPPAPGSYTYDVNWNNPVDPSSVQTSDLQLSGNTGASVTAVTVTNGNMTTEFTLNIPFGGSLTAHIAAGAITDADGNPNADFSGNYTVSGCPPSQYTITDGADTIVPGDTDTGNHGDDVDTPVTIPFPFTLYDQTFTSVNVSSNGRLDFVVPNEPGGFTTNCLPAPPNIGPYDFTVFPVWQDMRTDFGLSGCANFPGGNCGVFTSVSGTAPNRIFNIEWRTVYFADNASTANFEARLYENGGPNNDLRFDVIVGTVQSGGDHSYVSGVQGNSGAGFFTQDFCDPNPPAPASHTYEIPPCATPSPSPTVVPSATPTVAPTVTPSATPSATPTATATTTPTPTPHHPTPRPRPTPHPRPTP
jgi:hypothetical protein